MYGESLKALLAWIPFLTGGKYTAPDVHVSYVPQTFLEEFICRKKECDYVGGAYMDAVVPEALFISDKFEGNESVLIRGIILHEGVHAAQYATGRFDSNSCADSIKREIEAFYIQDKYLLANGQLPPIRTARGVCKKGH